MREYILIVVRKYLRRWIVRKLSNYPPYFIVSHFPHLEAESIRNVEMQ